MSARWRTMARRRRMVARRWRTPARRRRLVAAVVLAPLLAGCSLSAPRSSPPAPGGGATASVPPSAATSPAGAGSAVAAKVARADRTHEVPTPTPRQRVAGGWRSPTEAVYVFATQYINWNANDVGPRLRALARVSVGQARSAMTEGAAQAASDYELQQGQIANSGVVEAIAPVVGHRYEYAVATREATSSTASTEYQGLAPEWHLALATVTQLSSGVWVLSGWQPES